MVSERLAQLTAQLQQCTNAKERINLLLDISAENRLYDIERAHEVANEALQLATAEDYQLGIGRGYYALGSSLWQKGDYIESVKMLKQARDIGVRIQDTKLEGKSYNMLGNVHRDMGELSQALGYYLNAQEKVDALGEKDLTGVIVMNIAITYYAIGEYDSALENALISVALLEEQGTQYRLFSIYQTLGDIYFKQGDLQSALTYFYKSLDLTQADTSPNALALGGIGKVHLLSGDLVKAQNYLTKAKDISLRNSYIESGIIACFYLGRMHIAKQELPQALQEYNTALNTAISHGRRHDAMSVHEYLAQYYEEVNDTANAYTHLKQYERLRNEIFEVEAINKLRNKQVLHDIASAKKEREVAMRAATLKQQFLANMSHEIRTPMNAVIGMTRMLLEKKHLPEQEKYLKAIKTSADNLLVILNDILDISKLESGKFQIEQIPFSLRTVISTVYNTLRIKAQEKEIDFAYEVEAAIPDVLIGDPTRLSQVLINLASNSIKFTDAGEVKILVRARSKTAAEIQLKFDVVDTGVGIDENYVHQLFEKFTQAGTDTARKYGGTGLGLSISKQLVSLMGGQISAKGKPGEGSTFTVDISLPIEATQTLTEAAVEEITNKEISTMTNKRVLLVEDNEFNQMLALDTLRDFNAALQIDVALNGKIAVEKATQHLYDVILMDIQMPVMNGVQATQLIRSTLKDPYNKVPIIAMTANVMKEDIDQYLASGMNDYVSKPFAPHVLVHKMIKYFGELDSVALDVKSSSEPSKNLPDRVTSFGFLEELTKGDKAKQKKYMEIFLRNAAASLQQAKQNLSPLDRDRLKVNVHSLKGQLAYMGVSEEVSAVQALERACLDASFSEQKLKQGLDKLSSVCEQTFEEVRQQLTQL
ncbi:MAG: hypothetical protein RL660_2072 [Bacteroidota bacterium]|jgi:signal transduction histidine kinase/DNA-binding response OmpR family regulator